jgi:tetratricopeptide (TPR) repeat protein
MKLASTLALALLAGCATARSAGGAAGGPAPAAAARADLAELSRAMTVIDDAERRGDIAAERAHWSAAAAADPADLKARFLAIYALPHTEDTWGELHWLAKDRPESALGPIGMARFYVEWKVLDQVERTLPLAAEAEPDNWLVTLVQAQAAEKGERWEAAAAGYRTVLGLDPSNVEAHVGLARLARHAGDPAAARAEATAALAGLPEHVPALRLLADLAAEAGDQPAAAGLLQRIAAASPRDRAARVALAKVLAAKGDHAAARDQWRSAILLKEDADALVALAEESRLSGDRESERKALERLSQIDPGSAEWRRIAEMRLAANDADGAEKALRRVLARDAKDAPANQALGKLLLQAGKPHEALERFREAGAAGAADREALERRLNVERTSRPDVAGLQKAVGALIDRTYRGRLKDSPRLSGQLLVRVTVDGGGAATQVEVMEDSVHDEDVRACAYWNLRDAAYPPKKPGRYSFSFGLRPAR